jgi:protein-S-isoprenylcysteine O-methyltransferase Ste14
MAKDWPVLVVTLTIWAYWGTVFVLVLYKRLRFGQRAGVIPRHRWEKRLWWAVAPDFLGWNLMPFLAALLDDGVFGLPGWASSVPWVRGLRFAAAGVGVLCYLATLSCWLLMGRNWTMAIDPSQKTELITSGLFRWVRHPIYTLSILLMICTALVAPTIPMVLVAVLHITVMNLKAKNEERHLTQRHGLTYGDYCNRVGRFVPRLRILARS